MQRLIALIAFAIAVGFLGILIFNVPEIDLIVIVTVTIGLIGYDFFTSARKNRPDR